MPGEQVSIYCADVGSIPRGRFGWAHADVPVRDVERYRGSGEIIALADAVEEDLLAGVPVALGFECPIFVPVPTDPIRLGSARAGDGDRAWSAAAGTGALATGLVQVAWILRRLHEHAVEARVTFDWPSFRQNGGLFLWEAFVTARAKALTHIDDAAVAVSCFLAALPNPVAQNAVDERRDVLSLIGSCVLWSGLGNDPALLRAPCLVLRAAVAAE